jgi:hypothetical protein
VTFGGGGGTVTNATATSVTVTVPAHAAGAVDVAVTLNGRTGTLTGGYRYGGVNVLPAPVASGGSPGAPQPLPGGRQAGSGSGTAPNPLPPPRP